MDIIQDIFSAFPSITELANETGNPVSTVDSWLKNNNVPRWQRPSVLDAARRLKIDLPAHVMAYLASRNNLPKVIRRRRASSEQAAA